MEEFDRGRAIDITDRLERASSVDGWEEFDRGRAIEHNRQELQSGERASSVEAFLLSFGRCEEEFDRGRAIAHNRQDVAMERASSVDGWEEFDRGRAIEHNRQESGESFICGWVRKRLAENTTLTDT